MAKNVKRKYRYHPIETAYLSPARSGRQTIRLLNRYAKLLDIPVQDAISVVLREVLPNRIADCEARVQGKIA